jgi:hypothetical protein
MVCHGRPFRLIQSSTSRWSIVSLIMRLKASPAAFVGMVYAADRESAIKTAIKQFEIRPVDQRRLLAIKR